MTAVDHEMLVAQLDRLKLTAIGDQLDTLLDEASRVQRNSVPSSHMRCMITARRRASATIALARTKNMRL